MHEPLDNTHNHHVPVYQVALTSLLFSATLPLSFIFFCKFYLDTWTWFYEPLHSLIESLGSFAAITLALFILIMRRNLQLRPGYLWVASTLMGMGVLDLFHASMPPGKVFIWLHSLATLLGGLTAALVLLPERLASIPILQFLPCATGVCSTFIGILSFFYPEYLPVMEREKTFSLAADSMNAIGGLGFLLAWFYFCLRDSKEQHQYENNILANFFLLFAIAALLFNFSIFWGAEWWIMHIVRLVAYLVLLRFFLKIYSRDIGHIKKSRIELKKRTHELQRTQNYLIDIIEYSPSPITLKDITGKFILVNQKFSDLFAYSTDQIVNKTVEDIFPSVAAQYQQDEDKKIIEHGKATENEEKYCSVTKELTCDPVEKTQTFIVDRFPLRGHNNTIYGVGTIMTDISRRKKDEAKLKSALLEKESLLKEIHHRVKNNMQIVASLMFLQAQSIENKDAFDILQESQDRIKSMCLVHELLYQSSNLAKVPFKKYMDPLVCSLRQSYNAHNVLLHMNAESIDLPVDAAMPCGLIVNELVTNSFKHAFTDKNTGEITISFLKDKTNYLLSVADNGPGFPNDYDWDAPTTLGINLIRTLSKQLDAELTFENHDGLTCRLHFSI